jgi:DNA-binding NtrC family response regulator
MEKLEILILGTNQPIVGTIARLIDKEGKWLATVAFDIVQAKAILTTKQFALVLIGAGLSEAEEAEFTKFVNQVNLHLPIVKHYGGGSGLLFAEIYQALQSK